MRLSEFTASAALSSVFYLVHFFFPFTSASVANRSNSTVTNSCKNTFRASVERRRAMSFNLFFSVVGMWMTDFFLFSGGICDLKYHEKIFFGMLRLAMITADQITIHLLGDYVTQSDWMASRKTQEHLPAFCHALVYSLPFLLFRPSLTAWLVIFVTHFFIDRYRLARYAVWAKNFLAPKVFWKSVSGAWMSCSNQEAMCWMTWKRFGPLAMNDPSIKEIDEIKAARNLPFSVCAATGYPPDRPVWLAVWLLILCDNWCHILINGLALKFL